ncbi:MAG: cytochrome c-type biogenesis protein [Methylococcaceae bacterium]|jgi:cytochrome c-type biogenesis protein CcmH
MKKIVLCLFLLIQSVHAEIEVYQFTSPELELRYQSLTEELRCLVCQNQNIADSHAELAQDLRRKVYEMLSSGQSNAQIIDYMTERYGDFVLYRPPFNVRTILLWFTPVLALLIGALGFMSILNRRETNADEQLSQKELARIKELLHLKSNKE